MKKTIKDKLVNLIFEEETIYYYGDHKRTKEALIEKKKEEMNRKKKLRKHNGIQKIVVLILIVIVFTIYSILFAMNRVDNFYLEFGGMYVTFPALLTSYFGASILINYFFVLDYCREFNIVYDSTIRQIINEDFILMGLEIVFTFIFLLNNLSLRVALCSIISSSMFIYYTFRFVINRLASAYKELMAEFDE